MTDPHSSVQYEGRDTQNRQVSISVIVLFAVMIGCSLLMIPLVNHLWHWAESTHEKPAAVSAAPSIILEVDPSRDYLKMQKEYEQNDSAQKIKAAMEKALAEGYPVKS